MAPDTLEDAIVVKCVRLLISRLLLLQLAKARGVAVSIVSLALSAAIADPRRDPPGGHLALMARHVCVLTLSHSLHSALF